MARGGLGHAGLAPCVSDSAPWESARNGGCRCEHFFAVAILKERIVGAGEDSIRVIIGLPYSIIQACRTICIGKSCK